MLEYELYEWLEACGINAAEYKVFNLDEELEADSFPVVLKISSSKIVHKTDVGAVVVNLDSRHELNEAKEIICQNLKQHGIELTQQDKFLVTKQYQGVELFFGIVNDPVFEKVIVFGAGGIFTELFKDICFIDSEAGEEEIKRAIAQTKIATLFTTGFRGQKYDISLVIQFIRKLQQLDVQEMDLNPVMLSKDSLTVVDGRMLPPTAVTCQKKIKYLPEIFSPKKIAIIGVSEHAEKVGYALAKNTFRHPDVYFVNPKLVTLLEKKVFNKIEDLPYIDTAVLAVPASSVGAVSTVKIDGSG